MVYISGMKYLRNAFDLYINSSFHVSLAVVAFTQITVLEQEFEFDLNLLLFIFFASITGYNFVKYAGIAKLYHSSLAKNLKLIQIFSFLSFLALIYFSFKQNLEVILASGFLFLLTVLYALPVFTGNRNLRSITGLKIFIISVVWAGTTVLLPLLASEVILDTELIVDFLQRFMLVILLTLPFEIRDLNYDNDNLGTIPQKLGIYKTKIFGSILALLIFFSALFQNSFKNTAFIALSLVLIAGLIFLWNSRKNQSEYYCSFWVESVPILYLGGYCLLRHCA